MKNLRVLLVVGICLVASVAGATLMFKFYPDTMKIGATGPTGSAQPVNQEGYYQVFVTEQQFGTGTQSDFDALPQQTKDDAVSQGNADVADIDAWTDREKAFAKVLLDEINILRDAAGLPDRTMTQLKTAIAGKL